MTETLRELDRVYRFGGRMTTIYGVTQLVLGIDNVCVITLRKSLIIRVINHHIIVSKPLDILSVYKLNRIVYLAYISLKIWQCKRGVAVTFWFLAYLTNLSVAHNIWRKIIRWSINNKLERMWKKVAWVSFKILTWNLLECRKILRVFCWFPGRCLNTRRLEHEAGFLLVPLRRVKEWREEVYSSAVPSYEEESVKMSQMDIRRKICDIRTGKKHLSLDMSSTNMNTRFPSPY